MPRAAKLCRKPDCYRFRPCPEPGHEPRAWEGSTRRKRLPSNWPKLRIFVLERDGGLCQVCKVNLATEVDHIDPDGGDDPQNLQAICSRPCHAERSKSVV